ncbi:hypothetical protein HDV01_002219 [Terramyces sp. JEL0728]|nr:hypothetical protein HDV01_002219 [Terramyces sp. JEL0728]
MGKKVKDSSKLKKSRTETIPVESHSEEKEKISVEPQQEEPKPNHSAVESQKKEESVKAQTKETQQEEQDTLETKPVRKYVPGLNTAFVYTTEYTKQKVYELNWQNIPVMRRISDDYMNASNILQAAQVPKDKRKKIIKKLCSLVPFERIEEGYFKYQGVWVPLKAAKSLAERWNVYEFIKPIFDK